MNDPDHVEEFEQLSRLVIELSVDMLAKHGSFAPFGGAIDRDGELFHFGCDTDDPGEALQLLAREVRKADVDVAVFAADVRVVPPGSSEARDCIMFFAEGRNGIVIRHFMPYWFDSAGLELGDKLVDPDPEPFVFSQA